MDLFLSVLFVFVVVFNILMMFFYDQNLHAFFRALAL